jgi:diguanylate cyclase (GGDEF)-like protein
MTFASYTALVFGFDTGQEDNTKRLLWIAMSIVIMLRFTDVLYWRVKLKNTDYNYRTVLSRFSIGLYVTGALWALYPLLLYPKMSTPELAATMVILAAMSGGAASILAPRKSLVSFYVSALLLPISMCALLDAETTFVVLGLLGVFFWVNILIVAFTNHRFYSQTLLLREHSNFLVKQMRKERHEFAEVNEMLRQTNARLDDANANLEQQVETRTADIIHLSNRDPLTNLLNRNGFLNHLNDLLKTSHKTKTNFALLFIDLDGFKQVNDSLGHKIGDLVLTEIATRLTRYCEPDHLARWGGDEFVAVLPYATVDTAKAVANAIRGGVKVPILAAENQVTLDATIGIAVYPHHGNDALSLIQQADLTMYDQKRKVRGSVGVFDEELHERIKAEQQMHEDLRHAIRRGELCVYYQPILSTLDKKVVSVEALLRWNRNGVMVSPVVFIPLAERIGLMPEIGTWVLNRACIDASQWSLARPISLSVNVSINQLVGGDFIHSLKQVLETTQLPPSSLSLEITESVFAKNETVVANHLQAIKQLGVKISIDDFGTGYSSLHRLQSMPCDFIKIDRSFVQNTDEGSGTIVRATMFIAREFGCKTIAEGIETPEQVERLTGLGVDYLQGFLYSTPMCSTDFTTWYNENQ